MIAEARAAVAIPDELSSVDAAPLLCAGVTTFNALRNAGVRAGLVIGLAADPLKIDTLSLVSGMRSISGSLTGSAIDEQDALEFSVLESIRPMVETMPLSKAPGAYARMLSGKARFRIVLVTDNVSDSPA